jgi:4-amino-4-deoxy-L-arabinose transferase-like glycosyltransferase
MAFVFLFSSLYFFYEAIGNKISFKLLFGLVLIPSVLLHYNNLLITLVLCIPIFIYKVLREKYSIKKLFKDILGWLSVLVGVGIIFYLQLEVLKSVSYFYTSILSPLEPDERFNGIIGFADFANWFLPENHRHIDFKNSVIILSLGVVSYMVVLVKFGFDFIKKKVFNKQILFLFLVALCFYLALYIELGAITRHFDFNKLILFLIPISYVIGLLFKKDIRLFKKFKLNYLLIFVFIIVGGWNIYNLYERYMGARVVSVVRQEDVKAFEWMDENIPKGSYIIPAHIQNKYSYVLDSALYMKAFTDNYELFPFVDGEIPDNQRELKNSYLALKDNPKGRNLLNDFTSSGIYYIFSGSHTPWGCGELPCGFFDGYPEVYEVIYDLNGVRIYKIVE